MAIKLEDGEPPFSLAQIATLRTTVDDYGVHPNISCVIRAAERVLSRSYGVRAR